MATQLTVKDRLSKHKVLCDRFVVALLRGYSKREAAIMAGVPVKSSYKRSNELMGDPYVQERYNELYEQINDEEMISRKDILFGLLNEARDKESPGGTQAARVSAWNALARLTGIDKPTKLDVNVNGGVMLVPVTSGTATEWEALAAQQQQELKDAVRK